VNVLALIPPAEVLIDRMHLSWDVPMPIPVVATYAALLGKLHVRFGGKRSSTKSGPARGEALRGMTVFVRAKDVMRALGCSRALAYAHVHRAGARRTEDGHLIGVPLEAWEKYARTIFEVEEKWASTCGSGARSGTASHTSTGSARNIPRAAPVRRRLGPFSKNGSETPLIPTVQPRRRRSTTP
jgi:hypothetical protein